MIQHVSLDNCLSVLEIAFFFNLLPEFLKKVINIGYSDAKKFIITVKIVTLDMKLDETVDIV